MNGKWVRNRYGRVWHYINLSTPLTEFVENKNGRTTYRWYWTLCGDWKSVTSIAKPVRKCPKCLRKLNQLAQKEQHGQY